MSRPVLRGPGPSNGARLLDPSVFVASCVSFQLRPLPSTGITRLHQNYGPLRHPIQPGPSLASCRLITTAITAGASRVATGQLCLLAVAITPAGLMELVRSYCPISGGPPTIHGARAPALQVSRPAQRSLHVTAYMLAKSPKRPSTPEAPTASLPPPPL
jgi:hypothetical protein